MWAGSSLKNDDLVAMRQKDRLIDKVYWCNINQIEKSDTPDYLIAMGDANLLFYFDCKTINIMFLNRIYFYN